MAKTLTMQPHSGGHDERLAIAERVLGHTFADRALLRRALTHPSALDGGEHASDYERLEFLGDSVVGFVVAEEVFRRFPSLKEGGMTRIKVSAVNGVVLSTVAAELGLGDAMILGESELGTGRRGMSSALENTFEALVAALYLDAGLEVTRAWVLRALDAHIRESLADTPESPKSLLQEIVQAKGGVVTYRITSQDGPPHDRTFRAQALIDGEVAGQGGGRSKKEAEASAALDALDTIEPKAP